MVNFPNKDILKCYKAWRNNCHELSLVVGGGDIDVEEGRRFDC
jgi:hypothetical protein